MDINKLITDGKTFIEKGLWHADENESHRWKRRAIATLRILVMTVKGYFEGKMMIQASALTYYTLLSIVPAFALAFAIAKGFGLDSLLTDFIQDALGSEPETADYLINFASNALDNAKGGLIAGVGVVMLLYSVYGLLNNIEKAFNNMWCVKGGRPLARKVSDYLCIMIVAPILLILSNSATVFIRTLLQTLFPDTFSTFQTFLLSLVPCFLMIIAFTLLFLIMPNTKVQFRAALIAGVFTGIAYELIQWVYLTFQVGVSKAGAIYGSFAFLPLFLAWLQIVWTLVLAGCKIAFSIQNVSQYSLEQGAEKVNVEIERKLALLVMKHVTQKFVSDSPKTNGVLLSTKLGLPKSYFYTLMDRLIEAGLIVERATEGNGSRMFAPGMDVAAITPALICNRLDNLGSVPHFPALTTDEYQKISTAYDKMVASGRDTDEAKSRL